MHNEKRPIPRTEPRPCPCKSISPSSPPASRLRFLPGPVVTLMIANGLRYGTRAALTNIAGVQAGLAIVIGIVAVGLTSLMATMGYWFDWVRFAGAAYLVWLGIKLIRFPVEGVKADEPPPPPRGGFFLQGFVVLLSNPKVLVFFGAFIPQFVDMNRDHVSQVTLLGVTFMVIAGLTDAPLRAARGPSAHVLLGAADAAGVAHFRRLHDRRRHLARADAVALDQPRSIGSISPRIRASRSAHCCWPA